jgi:hypothetical protein
VPEAKPEEAPPRDIEADVDDAIAVCNGDLRATIRALILANNFLHAERERLHSLASSGFMRGKLSLLDLP